MSKNFLVDPTQITLNHFLDRGFINFLEKSSYELGGADLHIKDSVYRNGGTISWSNTPRDLLAVFRHSRESLHGCLMVTAPIMGAGKSTAFEFLDTFYPLRQKSVTIEGDILSLIVLLLNAGITIDADTKFADLAKRGVTTRDGATSIPWSLPGASSRKAAKLLTDFIGSNFTRKICLCTDFLGASELLPKAYKIVIRPTWESYVKNLSRRITHMVNDGSHHLSYAAFIGSTKILSLVEFNEAYDRFIKRSLNTDFPIPRFRCFHLCEDEGLNWAFDGPGFRSAFAVNSPYGSSYNVPLVIVNDPAWKKREPSLSKRPAASYSLGPTLFRVLHHFFHFTSCKNDVYCPLSPEFTGPPKVEWNDIR